MTLCYHQALKGSKVFWKLLEASRQLFFEKAVLKIFRKFLEFIFVRLQVGKYAEYHISPNKGRTSNKCHAQTSAPPLGIHTETSASL